jgi:polysaccharide biosynthesis protein PslG
MVKYVPVSLALVLLLQLVACVQQAPQKLPAQVAPQIPPAVGSVAPTFFGMVTHDQGIRSFPQASFGAMRLWDTGTQWKDLEPSNGAFHWLYLDAWVAEAKANNKDVLLTFAGVPP